MTVKLVAITEDRKIESVEFRLSTGLSIYTESFIHCSAEKKAQLHMEMRKTIDEFKALGIIIEYDFRDCKMF